MARNQKIKILKNENENEQTNNNKRNKNRKMAKNQKNQENEKKRCWKSRFDEWLAKNITPWYLEYESEMEYTGRDWDPSQFNQKSRSRKHQPYRREKINTKRKYLLTKKSEFEIHLDFGLNSNKLELVFTTKNYEDVVYVLSYAHQFIRNGFVKTWQFVVDDKGVKKKMCDYQLRVENPLIPAIAASDKLKFEKIAGQYLLVHSGGKMVQETDFVAVVDLDRRVIRKVFDLGPTLYGKLII